MFLEMPRDLRSIRIDKAMNDFIQGYIDDHPELGYRSVTHFIEEKLREEIKRIKEEEKNYSREK
ncbi:MAG: hypothetical protein ACFFCS_00700 [Candidatus Hodarchaeota archaeon]